MFNRVLRRIYGGEEETGDSRKLHSELHNLYFSEMMLGLLRRMSLTLFILVCHTTKLNYRIIVSIAFTCLIQLTVFRRHRFNMFRNYCYKDDDKYLQVFI
jgi:hypothetical protein